MTMEKASYQEYLKTEHWQKFKARALNHYGRKCYTCGEVNGRIDLHHNNYLRLRDELLSDVIPLCQNCHELFHGITKRSFDISSKLTLRDKQKHSHICIAP